MRILIDIGHPAHVHVFKFLARELMNRGHEFHFTVRESENSGYLLEKFGYNFTSLGKKKKGSIKKLFGTIRFTLRICMVSRKFHPDMYLSHGSMYAGYAAFLFRKPHLALEDSGNLEQLRLSVPVSDVIISPFILPVDFGHKHIRYDGYHEIMYLHPKYFTPDKDIFTYLKINSNEPYAILRFVSWSATHDRGQAGLSIDEKRKVINYLSQKLKVFISNENDLDSEFESFKIDIPPEKMHDALSFASIYIGEGATMASEAGILGTPSFYVSTIPRCYNEDQERYGTVFNFKSFDGLIEKIDKILGTPDIKAEWIKKRNIILNEKIDVTAFLIWFVENWPESFRIMKENPRYQETFKFNLHKQ